MTKQQIPRKLLARSVMECFTKVQTRMLRMHYGLDLGLSRLGPVNALPNRPVMLILAPNSAAACLYSSKAAWLVYRTSTTLLSFSMVSSAASYPASLSTSSYTIRHPSPWSKTPTMTLSRIICDSFLSTC